MQNFSVYFFLWLSIAGFCHLAVAGLEIEQSVDHERDKILKLPPDHPKRVELVRTDLLTAFTRDMEKWAEREPPVLDPEKDAKFWKDLYWPDLVQPVLNAILDGKFPPDKEKKAYYEQLMTIASKKLRHPELVKRTLELSAKAEKELIEIANSEKSRRDSALARYLLKTRLGKTPSVRLLDMLKSPEKYAVEQKDVWDQLNDRWSHRIDFPFSNHFNRVEEEEGAKKKWEALERFIRISSNPDANHRQVEKAFQRVIGRALFPERWARLQAANEHTEAGDPDSLARGRMKELTRGPLWKYDMLDYDPDFRSHYVGEPRKPYFLMGIASLDQPKLIEGILEEAGARIHFFAPGKGKPGTLLTPEEAAEYLKQIPERFRSQVEFRVGAPEQLKHNRWIQDYRAIYATRDSDKRTFYLDPIYLRAELDEFPEKIQQHVDQTPVVPLPLKLEPGMLTHFRGKDDRDHVLVSRKFVEDHLARGWPEEELMRVARQYLGDLIVVPYSPNNATGHTDMELMAVRRGGDSDLIFIPSGQPQNQAARAILNSKKDDWLGNLNATAAQASVHAQIQAKIKPYADVERFDSLAARKKSSEEASTEPGPNYHEFSHANSIQFRNKDGESVIIIPTYPGEVGNAEVEAKLKAQLGPYFKRVKFVPTDLYHVSGGFHCSMTTCWTLQGP